MQIVATPTIGRFVEEKLHFRFPVLLVLPRFLCSLRNHPFVLQGEADGVGEVS